MSTRTADYRSARFAERANDAPTVDPVPATDLPGYPVALYVTLAVAAFCLALVAGAQFGRGLGWWQ